MSGPPQDPPQPTHEPALQHSGSVLSAPPVANTGAEHQAAPLPHTGETSDSHSATNLAPAPAGEAPSEQQQPIAPPAAGQPIQDPADIAIDADSAYGDDEVSVYTTSITSSVVDFPVENGRRYHAYREGTYVFPNDEPEQDRMDIQHEMYKRAVSGRLHLAPLPSDMKDRRILDLGTGTGIWCVEMGEQYPDAVIIGNDFSPVQPSWVPRNVKFEIDDVESPWTHTEKFDYIHSRFMAGAIANWPGLIRQIYDALQPGGIIECQDGDFMTYSEDGSTRGSWLEKWNTDFVAAAKQGGRIVQPGLQLETWIREAGFEDVHHERLRIPVGIWPKDKQLKEVGAFNLVQLREGVEGFSMALFTRVLNWSSDEVQVLLSKVRKDLDNRNIHAQNDM